MYPDVSGILRKICFFFLLLMISTDIVGQEKHEKVIFTAVGKIDTNYIANYTELLTARIYGLFQGAALNTQSFEFKKITYRSNYPGRIGIAAFHKWFGLGLSIGIPFLVKNQQEFGKSSFYDLRVNAYGNQISAELFIQNYKNFYLTNLVDINNKAFKVPGMNIFSTGISGYYYYNYRRFSIRSAFIQTERQKRSAGSFAVRPSFIFYRISSPEGIVPPVLAATITAYQPEITKEGRFYSLGLAPGYTYTLVFLKYLYLNGAAFPGFFFQKGTYITNFNTHKVQDIALSLNAKLVLGYNSPTWFAGGSMNISFGGVPATVTGTDFFYDVSQFRIWGGTRFNWFKKKK